MIQTMSPAGLAALTKKFEGLVLGVYPDPGSGGKPLTAGYGHTGPDVKPGMVVTQEQADAWLRADIAAAEATVRQLVTVQLTQHEFDALVDFEYNTGRLGSSSLLRKVNAGNFAAATAEFGRWTLAHGQVLAGLVARRRQEAAWFASADGLVQRTGGAHA
jgi:lysozyme